MEFQEWLQRNVKDQKHYNRKNTFGEHINRADEAKEWVSEL